MIEFIQNGFDGIFIGSLYVLLALGFNLTFGVMRRLNLAYGPTIMVGLFAGAWAYQHSGSVLFVFGSVLLGTLVAGAYVERVSFRFVPSALAVASMVSSFAIWMQFEEGVTLLAPDRTYALPPFMRGSSIEIGKFSFSVELIVAFVIATSGAVALYSLVHRTQWGTAVRAISEQPAAAKEIGLNVPGLSTQAMGVASIVGALSGFLIGGIEQQIDAHFGLRVTLKGLIAIMLGGIGSMSGAVVGGLTLGFIESESAAYLGPEYRQLVDFGALFLIAVARPQGLLGSPTSALTDSA